MKINKLLIPDDEANKKKIKNKCNSGPGKNDENNDNNHDIDLSILNKQCVNRQCVVLQTKQKVTVQNRTL